MKTVTDPASELKDSEVIVAAGVFDGVHLGHQELFKAALEAKRKLGIPVLALTFYPHPRTLMEPSGNYYTLLTPEPEKMALVQALGVDYYWAVPFTRDLSKLSPRRFVEDHLCRILRTKHVVCGFNFTFGYKGQGKPRDLETMGNELGFTVSVVPPYRVGGEVVSSTRIRQELCRGSVEEAGACLGRPYCVYGTVVKGDGIGNRMGFPTSNIAVPGDKFLPANGVYAAWVRMRASNGAGSSDSRPCVVNIGTRPTFGGKDTRVEVHIPGFAGELYGKTLQVFFAKRIREERKFPDLMALKRQIQEDVGMALAWLEAQNPLVKAFSFTLIGAYDRIFHANLP
ncbi:MAG TPA: bifunctional riboflavin kinase/FAD synthetase [Firmicutes bacterium]|nr:bifunctional riboflavin kinase/FAD synthetase [Candidatus Fermentithermobacillaceae bacterium]